MSGNNIPSFDVFLNLSPQNWFITNGAEGNVPHAVGSVHPVVDAGNVTTAGTKTSLVKISFKV